MDSNAKPEKEEEISIEKCGKIWLRLHESEKLRERCTKLLSIYSSPGRMSIDLVSSPWLTVFEPKDAVAVYITRFIWYDGHITDSVFWWHRGHEHPFNAPRWPAYFEPICAAKQGDIIKMKNVKFKIHFMEVGYPRPPPRDYSDIPTCILLPVESEKKQ